MALLNAVTNIDLSNISFNTDSYSLVIDSRVLFSTTPFKSDYISSTYKELNGIIILGITSRLKAKEIGLDLCKIIDNDGNLIYLQIDKLLLLEKLQIRLLSLK